MRAGDAMVQVNFANAGAIDGGTVWFALLVTGVFAGALGYLVATWVQSRTTAARAAHRRPLSAWVWMKRRLLLLLAMSRRPATQAVKESPATMPRRR